MGRRHEDRGGGEVDEGGGLGQAGEVDPAQCDKEVLGRFEQEEDEIVVASGKKGVEGVERRAQTDAVDDGQKGLSEASGEVRLAKVMQLESDFEIE
jgi:hypothetical protein